MPGIVSPSPIHYEPVLRIKTKFNVYLKLGTKHSLILKI